MPYSGHLNLASPASRRIFQRDVVAGDPVGNWTAKYGKGWSTIALGISPDAPAAFIEYRVRDDAAPTNPPLLDWSPCAGPVPVGPTSVAVTLPARAGWYLVDLRADGDTTSISTTNVIGVGEVIAASGQSLASDLWSTVATGDPATLAGCGVTASPLSACLAAWDGAAAPSSATAWAMPNDGSTYTSTFSAEFLRLAVLGTGVNCALVGYAWSGEPIASWRSDGLGPKNVWSLLVATLDNAVGPAGKFGTFIWVHGHNDARIPQAGVDGDSITSSQYVTALSGLFEAVAAQYGKAPFSRILSSIPAIGANWITQTPKFTPASIEQIRAAHLQYARVDPLVLDHVDGLDVPLWSDGTHPSQSGNIIFARHFYRAFMKRFTTVTFAPGDRGPAFLGRATRSPGGAQVFLSMTATETSSLSCVSGSSGAASQFRAFKSGSTAPGDQLPIQKAEFPRPGLAVLTLDSIPPDSQGVEIWYRLPPDDDLAMLSVNQIYDGDLAGSTVDGLTFGRQLAVYPSPIFVPPPARPSPALIGPGITMLASPASLAFAC